MLTCLIGFPSRSTVAWQTAALGIITVVVLGVAGLADKGKFGCISGGRRAGFQPTPLMQKNMRDMQAEVGIGLFKRRNRRQNGPNSCMNQACPSKNQHVPALLLTFLLTVPATI